MDGLRLDCLKRSRRFKQHTHQNLHPLPSVKYSRYVTYIQCCSATNKYPHEMQCTYVTWQWSTIYGMYLRMKLRTPAESKITVLQLDAAAYATYTLPVS